MKSLSKKISRDLPLSLMLRLIPAFVCSTAAMIAPGIHGWLVVAVFSLLVSCSSAPPIAFQNTSHRQVYSLNLEDLEKLQFYISRDVVAQYQDATGTKALLLPRLTPGVVTGAGPNWLKVSFKEGGIDVPFITDPNQYDGRYWIATEVEGSKDFKKVMDLPEIYSLQGNSLQAGFRRRCHSALRLGWLEKPCRDTHSYRGATSGGHVTLVKIPGSSKTVP